MNFARLVRKKRGSLEAEQGDYWQFAVNSAGFLTKPFRIACYGYG